MITESHWPALYLKLCGMNTTTEKCFSVSVPISVDFGIVLHISASQMLSMPILPLKWEQ